MQGGPKKAPYFVFYPKVVFYNFFSIFFRWCRQQAWEIILAPIWIQVDAILHSSRQKSLRLTLPQNQFFWHSGNAGKILAGTIYMIEGQFYVWWPNFGRQMLTFRTEWQMLTKPRPFIVWHNYWEYSEFTGTPWGFPRKSTRRLLQENISFKDPPWWP